MHTDDIAFISEDSFICIGLLQRGTLTHIGLAAATVIVTVVERRQMCTHNSNDLQVFLVSAFCHYKFFHNRVGAVGGELRLKYKQKITNVNCSNALLAFNTHTNRRKKGKGSPFSITESRVPELILVLGSQPAGDVCQKRGGRLPLLSARPAVTHATLKWAATNFAAW